MYSPFEKLIREKTDALARARAVPVGSAEIARAVGQPVRTVQHYLRVLEDKGGVYRPAGYASGYSTMPTLTRLHVVDDAEVAAAELTDAQRDVLGVLVGTVGTVPSRHVGRVIESSARTARHHLNNLEDAELVHRPDGARRGYGATALGVRVLARVEARVRLDALSVKGLRILRAVRDLERMGVVVDAPKLAGFLDMPERTMRHHLTWLRQHGYVCAEHTRPYTYTVNKTMALPVLALAEGEGMIWHD